MPRMIKTLIQTGFTPNWSITNLCLTFDSFYAEIFTSSLRSDRPKWWFWFMDSKLNSCAFICQFTGQNGLNRKFWPQDEVWLKPFEVKMFLKTTPEISQRMFWCNKNFGKWKFEHSIKPEIDRKWPYAIVQLTIWNF